MATPKFSEFLVDHREGQLDDELGHELAEAVLAVRTFGKTATVTMKLTITAKGSTTVVVMDDVAVKAPAADRESSIYFPDVKGELHRSDPTQERLPLIDINRKKEGTTDV